ncbi:hypothetical protein [Armatimonas rosea]|uniref:Pimeloyl-ACP methyl ester carboxylesterase n=1 Tax=Armatimonas rosea TaxID=685828 RepID=A0A7W9SQS8_ARMRO|nr:hypothetical protein [Armatimonas rosea]MBB6050740.1 pimeloyl-ACP methyl ester carboxylesterase [Armatimonas rosea]
MNDLGQVIGHVYNNQSRDYHSFVWKPYINGDGSSAYSLVFTKEVLPPVSLLTIVNSTNSMKALSINNQGIISGSFVTFSDFGFWDCPALWDANDGHSIFLEQAPSEWAFWTGAADKINNYGTITGLSSRIFGERGAVWKLNYGSYGQVTDVSYVRIHGGFGTFDRGLAGLNDQDQGTGNFGSPNNTAWKAKNIRNPSIPAIGDDYTELSYPNASSIISSGINLKGEIGGTATLNPDVRSGSNDDGFRVVFWDTNNSSTVVTTGECSGINNSGSIVGNHHGQSGNVGVTENDWFPFIWDKTKGIRRTVISDPKWEVRSIVSINNVGQVLAYAIKDGNYSSTFPVLLTPVNFQQEVILPSSEISLKSSDIPNGAEREVDGIVCDNLSGMNPTLLNKLSVHLPPSYNNARVYVSPIGTNPGSVKTSIGGFTYYPPDEYNENPTPASVDDLTKPAKRKITLAIYIDDPDSSDGQRVAYKDIILARPPVVLVHGINSNIDSWNEFMINIQNQNFADPFGIRMPFVTVDNANFEGSFNGNGPIEICSNNLEKAISDCLFMLRNGIEIPNGSFGFAYGTSNSRVSFTDYKNLHLASKRVDVVGWSYGGLVTRWYLASKGIRSEAKDSRSWYKLNFEKTEESHVTDYDSQKDIRKFITIASMWRGVPLCNYSNEARSTVFQQINFGNAPFLFNNNFDGIINRGIPWLGEFTNIFLDKYSIEVMAVDSPWMRYLIYGTSNSVKDTSTPFIQDVAYGAIAGDNNDYLALRDSYELFNSIQSPTWFPYLEMEYFKSEKNEKYNLNDGIVPLWSAIIPGKTFVVNENHNSIVKNKIVATKALIWLSANPDVSGVNSDDKLSMGNILNDVWNRTSNLMSRSSTLFSWDFDKLGMAPSRQNDIYKQINGVGRINPVAVREIRSVSATNLKPRSADIDFITATRADSIIELKYIDNISGEQKNHPTIKIYKDAKAHKTTFDDLKPNTQYFVRVKGQIYNVSNGSIILKNYSDNDPFFSNYGFMTPRESDSQLSISWVRGSTTIVNSDIAFKLRFLCSLGEIRDLNITNIEYTNSSVGTKDISPSSNIDISNGNSQFVNVSASTLSSFSNLSCKVRYRYRNANGDLINASTAWLKVK